MQNLNTYKILSALCGSFILAGCPSDSSSTSEGSASESSGNDSDSDSNSDSVSVTVGMTVGETSTSDSASTTDPTDATDPSADSSTTDPTDPTDASSSTDPTSGSSSDGGSSSGGSSTDPSGSSSTTDPSGSTGTTGEVPSDGYGDCANNPEDVACLADEVCVGDGGVNAVCLEQNCVDATDCAIPATGDPVVTCLDVTGDLVNDCYLDCSMGETCPDGMICILDFVCIWPPAPPEPGQCPDVDLGSDSPQSVDGDNSGLGDDHGSSCGDGGGEDAMYQFTAPADGTYQFDTIGTGYDTILSVIDGCGGAEIDCNDDIQQGVVQSLVTLDMLEGESVIIVVDGYGGDVGPFTLNVSTL